MSVLMPAFNEEASISRVIIDWVKQLESLGIDYEFVVYDDGSTDQTRQILLGLSQDNPRIQAISQSNRGHGPTVLQGYQEASAPWVLQIDADGEISAAEFGDFWKRRNDCVTALV